MWWRFLISLLIVLAVTGTIWNFSQRLHEDIYLEIHSMQNIEEDTLSVFAQFVVTQTIKLNDPIDVSRFVIPLYFPARESVVDVTLRQESEIVAHWKLEPINDEEVGRIIEKQIWFALPQQLNGLVELEFAALDVDHDHQEQAVRLFIEPNDSAFDQGNYRIAQNEKKGDVSLRMYQIREWRAYAWEQFMMKPWHYGRRAGAGVLLLYLMVVLPFTMGHKP